ncbi:Translin-associated factor X-interacting 1 [Brachionus plicatilis]|uniref:Translin-associated factor X-interacting 1 n=1 Tax=Brachionus plicatilis TaxID=10195 RepID=A0A3M7QZ92_BRAPC|nr:Translin-associated factor X-interacting 1 [Brachionus plicatilis]
MELASYNTQEETPRLPPIKSQSQLAKIDLGNKYTIGNSTISVPPRNALKTSGENSGGVIDTWPAHSANQRPSNLQISLTKSNNLLITNAQAEGRPNITPKPKFLENLEKFLQRELKVLGCENSYTTSEARLQAYREAFEYLLEEFKTYKPILSSIKNEYELMLASQREKIRELEPLKQMLVTLADQCDHKLMQYREEEKIEIKNLKEEKKKLQDLVLQLKNDRHMLEIQVDKLQNELAAEHEKFRNEQDKRKLLIVDLNDLRFQQEEAKLNELKREKKRQAEGHVAVEEESEDDPVTLKIALRVCRQNLTDSMKRLTKMEADYGDVIPRRDYLALETVYKELEGKNENLEKEMKNVRNDYGALRDHARKLEEKLQEIVQELESSRESNTPRPDWNICGAVVEGGAERWRDISDNKSSAHLLEILISELDSNSKSDFTGYGISADIPAYLRYEGKLKNKKFSKKDTLKIITEFMNYRMQKEAKKESSSFEHDLDESWISFLKKKYINDAFEYSYNVNDACEKYSTDLTEFFQHALQGFSDEQVYFYEKKMMNILLDFLKENEMRDIEGNVISKSVLKEVLRSFFRSKNMEHLNEVIQAAEQDSSSVDGSRIEYLSLFAEENEDNSNSFLNMVKKFIKEERLNFANQISDSLSGQSTISPADVRKAIMNIDESITEKNIDRIVSWCFGILNEIENN